MGRLIREGNLSDCLLQLPKYAQTNKSKVFPAWKIKYIMQNRNFYEENKDWLDEWLKEVRRFENSHLKMEWNCGKNSGLLMYLGVLGYVVLEAFGDLF